MRLNSVFIVGLASLGLSWLGVGVRAQAVIQVSSYGAVVNDGQNDLQAIRAAIDDLPASDAILRFEIGTYDLYPREEPPTGLGTPTPAGVFPVKTMFGLVSKARITVDGQGAVLMCHDFLPDQPINSSYYNLFACTDCTDIEIRDLTVNMSRLPYTIGTCTQIAGDPVVTNVANRYFRIDIDPSFFATGSLQNMTMHTLLNWRSGHPNGQNFYYVQQQPAKTFGSDFYVGQITSGTIHDIKGRFPIGPGTFPNDPGWVMMNELKAPGAIGPDDHGRLQLGDQVVIAHQSSYYIAFMFVDCTRSFLTSLTVHTWPGMAVNLLRDRDVVIDGLQVLPDPARPWPVTTTADAIHVANTAGTLQVHDCHLEGMLDDGFNSYVNALPVTAIVYSNGVPTVNAVPRFPLWIFDPGSTWEFYDQDMIPLGTRPLVLSQNVTNPSTHLLTFASVPIGNIAYVCNLSHFPDTTEIVGTTVARNRGMGLILRRNTHVDQCLFEWITGSGIVVSPSIGLWDEGPGGSNVLVEGSLLQYCNRGWGLHDGGATEGTISVKTHKFVNGAWTTGPVGSIQDVVLRNLTIQDSGGALVCVRSTNRFTIDQCALGACNDLGYLLTDRTADPQDGGRDRYAAESLLFFTESQDITITNNFFTGAGTYLNSDRTWPMIFGFYTKTNNTGF
ncbi:MAG: hypothetical protein R3F30_02470 [Planctomycetota bacterium]